MKDAQDEASYDEIDLREPIAVMWFHKLFIIACAGLFGLFFAVNAVKLTPIYTATSIFKLKSAGEEISPDPLQLPFFGIGEADKVALFDRLKGRDFLIRFNATAQLENDPYFNPQPPSDGEIEETKEQNLDVIATAKNYLQNAIYWLAGKTSPKTQEKTQETREKEQPKSAYEDRQLVIDRIFAKYSSSVEFGTTDNGSLIFRFKHEDPVRAAFLANALTRQAASEIRSENIDLAEEQTEYLSAKLAEALIRVHNSNRAVSEFAFANSLSSPAALSERSALMSDLRTELRVTDSFIELASKIKDTLIRSNGGQIDEAIYLQLRETNPEIDNVGFRRLMGVPEALGAWEWPSLTRLESALLTLSDRKARVEREIKTLLTEAEFFAKSTEELNELKRRARVHEATYDLLSKQVESRTLWLGNQGDSIQIFQTATPPLAPSEPRKMRIVLIGIILGTTFGIIGAFGLFILRNRIYSRDIIAEKLGAKLNLNLPHLRYFFARSLAKIFKKMEKYQSPNLTELLIDISASTCGGKVLITSTAHSLNPFPTAFCLAQKLSTEASTKADKLAIILIGRAMPRGLDLQPIADNIIRKAEYGNIAIYAPSKAHLFDQDFLSKTIAYIDAASGKKTPGIIVASTAELSPATLRAAKKSYPSFYSIVLSKPATTSRKILNHIKDIQSFDANVRL